MTSDDTHSRTVDLLESNAYFGMKPTQVKLLKQVRSYPCYTWAVMSHFKVWLSVFLALLKEKVACLIDNDAHLALEQNNKYRIQVGFCILSWSWKHVWRQSIFWWFWIQFYNFFPAYLMSLQTKPHGHGDVHALLYSSGLLKQWLVFAPYFCPVITFLFIAILLCLVYWDY